MAEAAEYEGQGTSANADDNIVPFMVLLQDMSPETKKRDPKYVEGAEAGKWMNKATGKVYDSFDFQPCAFQRAIVVWVPRDAGGGLKGRYPLTHPTPEAACEALGGKQVPDPRDSSGKKMVWRDGDGNDLTDTRYQYGHIVNEDGTLEPVLMSFSSTHHGPARQFMTMQRGPTAQMPRSNGGVMVAPSWFRKYRVASQERTGNGNSWFVPKFEDYGNQGWIGDANIRAAGKMLNESVGTGKVQAGDESHAQGGAAAADDSDVPF
jgi:hypothetical protein